jgi:hypothetical protein
MDWVDRSSLVLMKPECLGLDGILSIKPSNSNGSDRSRVLDQVL